MIPALLQEQAVPAAPEAAGQVDLGAMVMHHLVDAHEIELPWGVLHLPTGWIVDMGPLGPVDFSPTKHVVFMALAALLLLLFFLPLAQAAKRRDERSAPRGVGGGMEAMVLYFRDEVVRRNIGHGADAYTPYILTLFFFILTMNLIGLVPWGGSATGNINVTAALAILTFILVEPHGMNPAGRAMMLVIMTPVEFLSKLVKPFALAIRLFANMTAGHTLILSLGGLMFIFTNVVVMGGVALGTTAMATGIMVLELFVAFLQAYIFAMLTSVFIGLIRHAH
jgi:F-type H+-transporting ATPase subunit a